jgi:hypothetical protein
LKKWLFLFFKKKRRNKMRLALLRYLLKRKRLRRRLGFMQSKLQRQNLASALSKTIAAPRHASPLLLFHYPMHKQAQIKVFSQEHKKLVGDYASTKTTRWKI